MDSARCVLPRNSARKQDLINRKVPSAIQPFFREFAGIEGTQRYEVFKTGKKLYLRLVLQKPERGKS